jgi:hypothetical protein
MVRSVKTTSLSASPATPTSPEAKVVSVALPSRRRHAPFATSMPLCNQSSTS